MERGRLVAGRLKEVICRCAIIGENRSLYFDYYDDINHEFWNYLNEEDRYIKELVDNKEVKVRRGILVDVSFDGTLYFKVIIRTRKKYAFEDLEKIGKAITHAIWNWESVIDSVQENRYFSCTYVKGNIPIKCIVENDFNEVKMDIKRYRRAIKQGKFWQFFPKGYSYYRELLDKNIMELSVEVLDNYRYRITTLINDYDALVEFFLKHHTKYEINEDYVIRNAGNLALFIEDAIGKWNSKNRGILV